MVFRLINRLGGRACLRWDPNRARADERVLVDRSRLALSCCCWRCRSWAISPIPLYGAPTPFFGLFELPPIVGRRTRRCRKQLFTHPPAGPAWLVIVLAADAHRRGAASITSSTATTCCGGCCRARSAVCDRVIPGGHPHEQAGQDIIQARRKNPPTQAEAEDAVRTLIRWAGDDPDREGLLGTPPGSRAPMRSCSPAMTRSLATSWSAPSRNGGYDELVVLRDIRFESHCEHHMVPIIGRAQWAICLNRVVGISKLARVVQASPRLQIQEKLTAEVADTHRRGAAAQGRRRGDRCRAPMHDHARRAQERGVSMVTSHMLGAFRAQQETPPEFLSSLNLRGRPRAV